MRNEDLCLEARRRGSSRLTLAMIATCRGDDTGDLGVVVSQPVDEGNAAANFESARRRVVFVFYPNSSACSPAQKRPDILRRGRHVFVDETGRSLDLIFAEYQHYRSCPFRRSRPLIAHRARRRNRTGFMGTSGLKRALNDARKDSNSWPPDL